MLGRAVAHTLMDSLYKYLPYNSEQYARTGEYLIRELYGRVAGIRMNGSAAIALCYVAAGRFDAWLEAFLGNGISRRRH